MYNLNVNVNPSQATTAGLLSVAGAEVTPRTPEIVNSLIAMTNPFDGYGDRSRERTDSTSSGEPSPPSIQHTCSQLIKEGLKLTLQTKRRANYVIEDCRKKARKEEGSADDEEEDESSNSTSIGLTPEDEERRRRRRERNKIAATKCRLKKREKTVILVQESETLESQNQDLKTQIQDLETQRRRLVEMLNRHSTSCMKIGGNSESYQQYLEPIPLPSYQNFASSHGQSQDRNSEYPVKVENFDSVSQDFYRQNSPYSQSDAGCVV